MIAAPYADRVIEVDSAGNIVWKYEGLNWPYDVERLGATTQAYEADNTIELTVNNVAPTLTLAGSSVINEGVEYTLGLFSSDPGDDTITEWEIDWGDGTVETIPGNPLSVTHIYADGPNDYMISAKAFDEDSYSPGNTLITDHCHHRVIEVDSSGTEVWSYSTGLYYCYDAERLVNGNTLITDHSNHRIIEVDSSGTEVWSYSTGLFRPHDAERLTNDNTLISDTHNNRIIQVDSSGTIVWSYSTGLNGAFDVDRLADGNTLIANTNSHRVFEIDDSGTEVWSFSTGLSYPRDIERFANGNTLIVNGGHHRVIEIDSSGTEVWSYSTGLNGPFDAERLANGNTLIADTYNNRVIEVDSTGTEVWNYAVGLYYLIDAERLPPVPLAYIADNILEVTVNNVAPILTLSGESSVDEGSEYTLELSLSDPGEDTITEWEIDWGDGDIETVSGNPSSVTHTYVNGLNMYTISATAIDEDDTFAAENTLEVTVINVAPTVSIDDMVQPNTDFILPNDELEFMGSFTDPGILDPHTIEWDFGDSTVITGTLTPTHTYLNAGEYTVTLTVWDDDGDFGTDTFNLIIENPMDVSEGVKEDLEELDVPPEAEKEVDNAIKDIEKAMDEFEEGDFLKAFDKLEDAVDDLMDAQDDGADTQEIIDAIVDLVQGIVNQSIDNTIEMIGEDDKNVIKAQEKYDKALELLEDGKFDKAINQFEKAYKQIMKAHSKYVPAGYMDDLEERLVDIEALKEGDISNKALNLSL